ncbi:MAG: hypothetical protein MR653_06080 [Clostridiales bacterium]|nr:hypothetical protein [Clostridiales bacterium]
MADNEFDGLDRLIEDSLDFLPPDDVVDHVSAGKTAFDLIIAGLALSTITLDILALGYILPLIGVVLLLLGFRRLRGENGWFKACFVISAVRCFSVAAQCIIAATVYHSTFMTTGAADIVAAVSAALVFALIICLRKGILAAQKRARLEPHAGGATALIIWYAVVCALALVKFEGLILVAGLVISFIFILRSLAKLARELDEASYAVHPSPVQVSDKTLCITLFSLVIVGVVCGYVFLQRLPMQWQPEQETQTTELRRELLEAGYPERSLRDLSDKDVEMCRGFTAVCTNDGDQLDNGSGVTLMTVAVKLDEPGTRYRIFTHFEWHDARSCGTELLRVMPYYMRYGARLDWSPDGEVTGRVLYDADGTTMVSPYYKLDGSGTGSISSSFFGTSSIGILGSFSMPADSENQRGYIAYGTQSGATQTDELYIASDANYVHQYSVLQFPVQTAEEFVGTGSFSESFVTVWDSFSVAN